MGRRKRRKSGATAFLGGLLILLFLLWKHFFVEKPASTSEGGLYTVMGHVAVTHNQEHVVSGANLLENLVTFLNPGDEFRILEVSGCAARVLITRHNNFPTSVIGWIPVEFLKKYALLKKDAADKL
ncbi:MAG TPA: hypothetical protein PKX93_02115 [bacterium]|nr:hypothetical protein [bacterium]